MYIQTSNEQLRALYRADLMGDEYDPPGVEFSTTGTAQVTETIGQRLVEQYDSITVKESNQE